MECNSSVSEAKDRKDLENLNWFWIYLKYIFLMDQFLRQMRIAPVLEMLEADEILKADLSRPNVKERLT